MRRSGRARQRRQAPRHRRGRRLHPLADGGLVRRTGGPQQADRGRVGIVRQFRQQSVEQIGTDVVLSLGRGVGLQPGVLERAHHVGDRRGGARNAGAGADEPLSAAGDADFRAHLNPETRRAGRASDQQHGLAPSLLQPLGQGAGQGMGLSGGHSHRPRAGRVPQTAGQVFDEIPDGIVGVIGADHDAGATISPGRVFDHDGGVSYRDRKMTVG